MISSFGTTYKTPQKRCVTPRKTPKTVQEKEYAFDGLYGVNSTTDELFAEEARPLVLSALEGFSVAIMACAACRRSARKATLAIAL